MNELVNIQNTNNVYKNHTLWVLFKYVDLCLKHLNKYKLTNLRSIPILIKNKNKYAYLKMKPKKISLTKDVGIYRVDVEVKTLIDNKVRDLETDIVLHLSEGVKRDILIGNIEYLYGLVHTGKKTNKSDYSKSLFYDSEFDIFTENIYNDENVADVLTRLGGYIFEDYNYDYNNYNSIVLNKSAILNDGEMFLFYKDKNDLLLDDYIVKQTIDDKDKSKYTLEEIEDIICDIDLIAKKEKLHNVPTIDMTCKNNIINIINYTGNKVLRNMAKNEKKIYATSINEFNLVRTPFFPIRPNLQRDCLIKLGINLINKVNTYVDDFVKDILGDDYILLVKYHIKPEVFNNEIEPDKNRTTIHAFAVISKETHLLVDDKIYRKDGTLIPFKNPYYRGE